MITLACCVLLINGAHLFVISREFVTKGTLYPEIKNPADITPFMVIFAFCSVVGPMLLALYVLGGGWA